MPPTCGTAFSRRGCRVLNDPDRTLCRVDLIRALNRAGVNEFTVYREHVSLDGCRFPVFLRGEHDHRGRRSGLLDDSYDVHTAIGKLRAEWTRIRATSSSSSSATPRTPTACIASTRRSKVGDEPTAARHLLFSRDWHVKEVDLEDEELLPGGARLRSRDEPARGAAAADLRACRRRLRTDRLRVP